ncbi:MAG: hypothetical protein HRT91_03320 [Piscirickettsiaceae bacterium]|nr:hypothetical protein [Piscirickettsiaceae bacterium]
MLSLIGILAVTYCNNIVEQSHSWLKQNTRQTLDWKSIEGAAMILHGENIDHDKNKQIDIKGTTTFKQYYPFAVIIVLINRYIYLICNCASEPL